MLFCYSLSPWHKVQAHEAGRGYYRLIDTALRDIALPSHLKSCSYGSIAWTSHQKDKICTLSNVCMAQLHTWWIRSSEEAFKVILILDKVWDSLISKYPEFVRPSYDGSGLAYSYINRFFRLYWNTTKTPLYIPWKYIAPDYENNPFLILRNTTFSETTELRKSFENKLLLVSRWW